MITSKQLLWAYLVFGVFYSILLLTGNQTLAWYMKPFLLPFLFYAVARNEAFDTKKWLLAALLFSWFGDCILLFAHKGKLYFIVGLIAFLIAHILFIVLFTKQKSAYRSFKNPLFWIGVICATVYLASLLWFLMPDLGDLTLPVIVYALTITIMLKTALKGTFDWHNNAKYTVLIGAVFFVISDSILAIDKFHFPMASASYSIMITYLIAQFCIIYGILRLNQKKEFQQKLHL